jgi:hypothetical protein
MAVLVEVLGREKIDRQRLDAGRMLAVAGATDELGHLALAQRLPGRTSQRGTDELVLVEIREERRSAPDAHEIDLRHLLSVRHRSE